MSNNRDIDPFARKPLVIDSQTVSDNLDFPGFEATQISTSSNPIPPIPPKKRNSTTPDQTLDWAVLLTNLIS